MRFYEYRTVPDLCLATFLNSLTYCTE
uniref:Uncharacterized protein n=1 Tax=Arundo donax TaxID=35708 RepID=A0A0A8YXM6_ARUDO